MIGDYVTTTESLIDDVDTLVANELRVRSVNSLGFTAGMQKNKRVGPACFYATKRIWKDTADWKINQLASMQADSLGFFSSANTPKEKNPAGWG